MRIRPNAYRRGVPFSFGPRIIPVRNGLLPLSVNPVWRDIEGFTTVAEVATEQLAADAEDSRRGLAPVPRCRIPKDLEVRLDLRR